MDGELIGGCVCGGARYNVRDGKRFKPDACHCTSCQSCTGSAVSEQLLISRRDLIVVGDVKTGEYLQPSGATSSVHVCSRCKVPLFSENSNRVGFATLRCGTLDRSAEVVPAAHVWTRSKQSWVTLPDNVPVMDEQPGTAAGWIELIGQR